jgi:AraC-like DNA-binding protein
MLQVLAPPTDLQPFVRFFWAVRVAGAVAPERVIPDGCCELIVHFGARPRRLVDGSIARVQPQAFVFGQIERAILLEPRGELDVFGVRFTPAGVAALWGVDASTLGPRECPLDDLFSRAQRFCVERIHDSRPRVPRTTSDEVAFALRVRYESIVDWLRATARREPARHARRADAALQSIHRPGADPTSVARSIGVSRRSVERDFRAAVGLSPAAYLRLRRIDECARKLRCEETALSTIALSAGYADQSHFCREFKDVVGVSPGVYRKQLGLAPGAFPD